MAAVPFPLSCCDSFRQRLQIFLPTLTIDLMDSSRDIKNKKHSSRMHTSRSSGSGGMMSLPVWSHVLSGEVWSQVALVPEKVGYSTTPSPVNSMTDRWENITFPQFRLRSVTVQPIHKQRHTEWKLMRKWNISLMFVLYYRPQGEGNIYRSVCYSVQ